MSDFEVIQELKNIVSALEEENKLLKKFIEDIEPENKQVFEKVRSKEKYKSIDWSY